MPAIEKTTEDVAALFARTIGTDPADTDPHSLNEAMRNNARPRFMKAGAGMTGANFAIAETGTFVVCTNEGNADIGASVPPVHIASIGIEKVLPKVEDLGVFIRLLSRSALGTPATQYTSHFTGPRKGGQLHIILTDNGRQQTPGHGGLLAFAQMHTLWSVHEYLPCVQAERRLGLSGDVFRADRYNSRPHIRRIPLQRVAFPFHALRFVFQRMPGEDRYSRPDIPLARSYGG